MVQHDPKYYDIGDPTEPLKPDWFLFRKWSQPWEEDIDGKQPKAPRCYHVEHVIEWQVFKQFVEADKDKNDDSRCALLQNTSNKTCLHSTTRSKWPRVAES
jgi:hypothetical protein